MYNKINPYIIKTVKTLKKDAKQQTEENPLKIVRDFQKKYRAANDKGATLHYIWQTSSNSSGELKQKNYSTDFQLI